MSLNSCRWKHSSVTSMLLLALGCRVDDRQLEPITWSISKTGDGGGATAGAASCESAPSGACTAGAGPVGVAGGGFDSAGGAGAAGFALTWPLAGSSAAGAAVAGTSSTSGGAAGAAVAGTSSTSGGAARISAGAAGAGASQGSAAGTGAAGTSGGRGGAVEACSDLDANGVLDRLETLVSNPSLSVGLGAAGWSAQSGVHLSWNSGDACQAADSGSLEVNYRKPTTEGSPLNGAAFQCLASSENIEYSLSAFIDMKHSESGSRGALVIAFFATADCTGTTLDGNGSGFLAGTSGWQSVVVKAKAPPSVRSMAVRLYSGRTDWATQEVQSNVLFDNVLLTESH